jgi:hypothetical protein
VGQPVDFCELLFALPIYSGACRSHTLSLLSSHFIAIPLKNVDMQISPNAGDLGDA